MLDNCSFRKTEQVEVEKTFSGYFFLSVIKTCTFPFFRGTYKSYCCDQTQKASNKQNKKSKVCVYAEKRQMFVKTIRAAA